MAKNRNNKMGATDVVGSEAVTVKLLEAALVIVNLPIAPGLLSHAALTNAASSFLVAMFAAGTVAAGPTPAPAPTPATPTPAPVAGTLPQHGGGPRP
jgi:hypothetical protein